MLAFGLRLRQQCESYLFVEDGLRDRVVLHTGAMFSMEFFPGDLPLHNIQDVRPDLDVSPRAGQVGLARDVAPAAGRRPPEEGPSA